MVFLGIYAPPIVADRRDIDERLIGLSWRITSGLGWVILGTTLIDDLLIMLVSILLLLFEFQPMIERAHWESVWESMSDWEVVSDCLDGPNAA